MKIKFFIFSLMISVSQAFAMEDQVQEDGNDAVKTAGSCTLSTPKVMPWELEVKALCYLDHQGLKSYVRTKGNSERLKAFRERCDEIYSIATPYVLEYLISPPDMVQYAMQQPVSLTYDNLFTNTKILIGNQKCDTDKRWLKKDPELRRLKTLRTLNGMDAENRSPFANEDLESFCSILKKMRPPTIWSLKSYLYVLSCFGI
ncbi:MAG: hypothetical protein BGO67_01550 [Alphaproteobacteria bacterium 41-28]|nr:MAG: hypothetical protein BGO67_01550 [Alphaproteobacteria bacterium 41-28]